MGNLFAFIERKLYALKVRNYFNPQVNDFLDANQLRQILSGQVANPLKLKDIDAKDYQYMVLGLEDNSPLNFMAGRNWGISGYSNAQQFAKWYMQSSSNGSSKIVVPSRNASLNTVYEINLTDPKYSQLLVRRISQNPAGLIDTIDGASSSFRRTLVSHLSVEDVVNCLTERFPSNFPSKRRK